MGICVRGGAGVTGKIMKRTTCRIVVYVGGKGAQMRIRMQLQNALGCCFDEANPPLLCRAWKIGLTEPTQQLQEGGPTRATSNEEVAPARDDPPGMGRNVKSLDTHDWLGDYFA